MEEPYSEDPDQVAQWAYNLWKKNEIQGYVLEPDAKEPIIRYRGLSHIDAVRRVVSRRVDSTIPQPGPEARSLWPAAENLLLDIIRKKGHDIAAESRKRQLKADQQNIRESGPHAA